jgi:hypothetical protein
MLDVMTDGIRVTVAAFSVRDDGRAGTLKKIDVSAQVGDGGIALIHQQVNKMGMDVLFRTTIGAVTGERRVTPVIRLVTAGTQP